MQSWGGCMRARNSFDNALPDDSDTDQTGRLRLTWWKSVPSLLLFWFAIGVLGCPQGHAQAGDKSLSGTVKSVSGAPVAGARLTIKNGAKGETTLATTNAD